MTTERKAKKTGKDGKKPGANPALTLSDQQAYNDQALNMLTPEEFLGKVMNFDIPVTDNQMAAAKALLSAKVRREGFKVPRKDQPIGKKEAADMMVEELLNGNNSNTGWGGLIN